MTITIDPRRFDAALFDLDGVLTDTARLHAQAWKSVFDDVLRRRAQHDGMPFVPFDIVADYRAHVDGRIRLDGVRTFLAARGIDLPEGGDDDPPGADTLRAIATRKGRLFLDMLDRGVAPLPGARALLENLRAAGVKIGVASASRNCAAVLQAAQLAPLIEARADGNDALRFRLAGKPDPALFLEAARRLGTKPARVLLFEDALPGVEAGRRGGFGCVVGVDRSGQADALRRAGADLVVTGLDKVRVAQ